MKNYSRRASGLARLRPVHVPFGNFPKVRTKQVARQSCGLLNLYSSVSRYSPHIPRFPCKFPLLDSSVGDSKCARQAGPGACPMDGDNDGIGVHDLQNPTYGLVCQGQAGLQIQTDTFLPVGHPDVMEDEHALAEFSRRLNLSMDQEGWERRGRKARMAREFILSETAVTKWIDGKGLPSMDHAVKLACMLDVCVEWLLTGRGDMRPPPPLTDEERRHLENLRLLSPQHRQHVFQTGEVLTPTPEADRAA